MYLLRALPLSRENATADNDSADAQLVYSSNQSKPSALADLLVTGPDHASKQFYATASTTNNQHRSLCSHRETTPPRIAWHRSSNGRTRRVIEEASERSQI